MTATTYGLVKAIRSHLIDSPTVESSLTTGRPNACNLCHLDRTLDWTADLAVHRGQRGRICQRLCHAAVYRGAERASQRDTVH